ncbi:vancomycin high temperature exclusion protein [Putridiphycobacter roseus]|uniref:Vancomycin high temperature exclusion protein n=1 Tax=Putridiphycobacter roseus TaxID=2219161 RepID=A0A2W1NIL2_9FLAO|nr:ElyC/SanA/YdcF family protein [Putridiphycobacter roseus]PZE17766.1 vancomycin high temperature exclusion protein [Putridiphycobacter roseus]
MTNKPYFKWLKKLVISCIIIFPLFVFSADYYIKSSTSNLIYSAIKNIPAHKVGMVLGTSKYRKGGSINSYYQQRIDGTTKLYHAGKIQFVLVSGDNGNTQYNEPETFKNDLIKAGIPANKIFLDYAGFRTLDSVVRAKAIFGQSKLIIISQKFHIERALYLAKEHDIAAIGFATGNYSHASSFRLRLREVLARTKAVIDILIGVEPKFYGDKIMIQ